MPRAGTRSRSGCACAAGPGPPGRSRAPPTTASRSPSTAGRSQKGNGTTPTIRTTCSCRRWPPRSWRPARMSWRCACRSGPAPRATPSSTSPSSTGSSWSIRGEQERLELEGAAASLRLAAPGHQRVVLYGDDGTRQVGRSEAAGVFAFEPLAGRGFEAVADGLLLRPAGIALDTPSTLASGDHRADYLVVTTAGLRKAVEPLVELRRSQGLIVETVDVQDV